MLAPDEVDFWKLRAVVQECLCMESLQQALKELHGDTSDGSVFLKTQTQIQELGNNNKGSTE